MGGKPLFIKKTAAGKALQRSHIIAFMRREQSVPDLRR